MEGAAARKGERRSGVGKGLKLDGSERRSEQPPLLLHHRAPLLPLALQRVVRPEEAKRTPVAGRLRLCDQRLDERRLGEVVAVRQTGAHDEGRDHVAPRPVRRAVLRAGVQHVAVEEHDLPPVGEQPAAETE